jgi:glycosyltransferase involved in cell wall biosynthesis
MKILIVIPAHNEATIIENNLDFLAQELPKILSGFDWELLVAENGSSDGTFNLAEAKTKNFSRFQTSKLPVACKGAAIKTAWDASSADCLIFTDADLATSPKHLPEMIEKISQGHDLIIGNRLDQRSMVSRAMARTFCSQLYNLLTKIILKTKIADHQCGFKGINKTAWQKISPHITSTGFFFDTELLALARKFKMTITEIPIVWKEQRKGASKSKVKIIKTGKNLLKNIWSLKKRLARLHY